MTFQKRGGIGSCSQAAAGPGGLRKDAERFLASIDSCFSQEGLERVGRILDDRGESPLRRRDALLVLSAAELRGADLTPVASVLERAAGEGGMGAFGSGLLARHLMGKGDYKSACMLYERSGARERGQIMLEARSRILMSGYDPAIETLALHILSDPQEKIASAFLAVLMDRGRNDPALAAMILAASTDVKSYRD